MPDAIPLSFLDGLTVPGESIGTQVGLRSSTAKLEGHEVRTVVPAVRGGDLRPLAYDFMSLRAASQSDFATTPVDAISTALLLGTAARRSDWVNLFFPPLMPTGTDGQLISTPTWTYPSFGVEQLDEYDTRLGEGQPFRTSGLSTSWLTQTIETYGWAVGLTMEEMARARGVGISWVERKLELPQRIVNRALEFQVAARLLDTTAGVTYASGNVTALGGGAEWDNGGDLLTDVGGAIDSLSEGVNVDRTDVRVVMTRSAFTAALKDAGYKASLVGTTLYSAADGPPNVAKIRDYVGAGSLDVINPTGAAGGSLLGDRTWVFTQGPNASDYDTTFGATRWSGLWTPNAGFAVEPWVERLIRTNMSAWMRQYVLDVFNPSAAILFSNCSAAV